MNIRTLRADEIECRVQTVKETGCSLLLYKDARCDMKILDEVFGPLGWEREHVVINNSLFCTVKVWDTEKKMWISKQDVGTESYTEKEKGQASDSFKRACFNLGIGRELYTAPFIWIKLNSSDISKNNNKTNVKTKFHVREIEYNGNKEINKLKIVDNKGNTRYELKENNITSAKTKLQVLNELADEVGADKEEMCKYYQVNSLADLNAESYKHAIKQLNKKKGDK